MFFIVVFKNGPPTILTLHSGISWLKQGYWPPHYLESSTYFIVYCDPGGSGGQVSTHNAGDLSSTPGLGRSPEKEMTVHSNTFAWRIPWTEEHGGLQPMGSQRVGHGWATKRAREIFMRPTQSWTWLSDWTTITVSKLHALLGPLGS